MMKVFAKIEMIEEVVRVVSADNKTLSKTLGKHCIMSRMR